LADYGAHMINQEWTYQVAATPHLEGKTSFR
jgi:hypothetical protein